jgi:hypothetical protein
VGRFLDEHQIDTLGGASVRWSPAAHARDQTHRSREQGDPDSSFHDVALTSSPGSREFGEAAPGFTPRRQRVREERT